MIIATEYGNFGSFRDLHKFMCLEHKNSVLISSSNWWGIETIISKKGLLLTKEEVFHIVSDV